MHTTSDRLMVHLLWGKQDFRYHLQKTTAGWQRVGFQIQYKQQWYEYQNISEHGLSFEETCWQNDADKLYIELPKKLVFNVDQVCKQVIAPQTATEHV